MFRHNSRPSVFVKIMVIMFLAFAAWIVLFAVCKLMVDIAKAFV